jgi:hypothetical protein
MLGMKSRVLWRECVRRKTDLRLWLGLLLLFALCQYGLRGTGRALSASGDFAAPYAATRVFWQRGNPYDQNVLKDELARAQLPGAKPYYFLTPSFYPPHTFVLLSPCVMMPWQHARLLMALSNTLLPLIAVLLFICSQQSRNKFILNRALCVLTFLLWAPLHTGIALGQLAVVSVSLGFIAIQLASSGHGNVAGIFLATSLFAKPHVAFLLPLYFVLRRWYRSIWVCVAMFFFVSLFVVAWWRERTVVFLQSVLQNYHQASTFGSISPYGPLYWHRIDLAPLWPSGSLIFAAVLGVAVIFLLFRLFPKSFLMRQDSDRLRSQELGLACICLVSLLVVYHRYYDAYLLLIPLAHIVLRYDIYRCKRRMWAICAVAYLPFLVPISATVFVLGKSIPLLSAAIESSVATRLLMLHVNISLLLALGYCLWAFSDSFRTAARTQVPVHQETVPDRRKSIGT